LVITILSNGCTCAFANDRCTPPVAESQAVSPVEKLQLTEG